MELKHGLISVDDHVQEPPDLWTSRLPKERFGERMPHLERNGDGGEQWVAGGAVLLDGDGQEMDSGIGVLGPRRANRDQHDHHERTGKYSPMGRPGQSPPGCAVRPSR